MADPFRRDNSDGTQSQFVFQPPETSGGYGNVTVTTSAQAIRAAATTRRSVTIYNNGSQAVYVGFDTSVTTSNGMPIPAGGEREIRVTSAIYGIVASGTADVRYLTEAT